MRKLVLAIGAGCLLAAASACSGQDSSFSESTPYAGSRNLKGRRVREDLIQPPSSAQANWRGTQTADNGKVAQVVRWVGTVVGIGTTVMLKGSSGKVYEIVDVPILVANHLRNGQQLQFLGVLLSDLRRISYMRDDKPSPYDSSGAHPMEVQSYQERHPSTVGLFDSSSSHLAELGSAVSLPIDSAAKEHEQPTAKRLPSSRRTKRNSLVIEEIRTREGSSLQGFQPAIPVSTDSVTAKARIRILGVATLDGERQAIISVPGRAVPYRAKSGDVLTIDGKFVEVFIDATDNVDLRPTGDRRQVIDPAVGPEADGPSIPASEW